MNVLVVTFNDSDNLTIENVLYEFENRGHRLTIYAPYTDENSIRMFKKLRAAIRPIGELNNKTVEKYDIAFCSVMSMQRMKLYNIYCFVYAPYFDYSFMTDGADFLFTYRDNVMPRCDFHCASMSVGDPKNDSQIIHKEDKKSNRILFIDSGHMPFGRKGKTQIAQMLLDICYRFPDYEVCIKPRWLRGQDTHYTHRNTEHLYDVIEELCESNLPRNLNMLNEHLNLQELIESSVSVIALYTAAVLNVVLQGKGLLIVKGWDNDDKWDIRNNVDLKNKVEMFEKSGCVIDYKSVLTYLPYGLQASEQFKRSMFKYKNGASKRIVDVVEYVYTKYLQKGMFPMAMEYQYETYMNTMYADKKVKFESLKRERIRDIIQQKLAIFSYKIEAPVDYTEYYHALDRTYLDLELKEDAISRYMKSFDNLLAGIVVKNAEILSKDPIDQSFLLKAYFDLGRYEDILNLPQGKILCKGPYHFYRSLIYQKQNSVSHAIREMLIFCKEAARRTYSKYPQENDWGLKIAWRYLFDIYDGQNISALDMANLCVSMHRMRIESLVTSKQWEKVLVRVPRICDEIRLQNSSLVGELESVKEEYEKARNERRTKELEEEIAKVKGGYSYRIGHAITWLPRKIYRFAKSMVVFGFQNTMTYNVGRIKRKFSGKNTRDVTDGIHFFRITGQFWREILPSYNKYKDLLLSYGEECEIYKTAGGIGDTYIAGMYFNGYIKKHHATRDNAVFTVIHDAGRDVAELFNLPNITIIPHRERQALTRMGIFIGFDNIHMTILHHNPASLYTNILAAMEAVHGMSGMDLLRSTIYDGVVEIDSPKFVKNIAHIDEIFTTHQLLRGKTIVCSPYAKSMEHIPRAFWEELADALMKRGYSVVTNIASDEEKLIWGTQGVYIPLREMVPFLDECNYIVGARSGLMDVTETAKVRRVILYANIRGNKGRGQAGNNNMMWTHFSFNQWFRRNDATELEYNETKRKELIATVVSHICMNDTGK